MEKSDFITGKQKLEFREIVLQHLKKILEISCSEFSKHNVKVINKSNMTEELRQEDNRKNYVQAVESLASILMPYFDDRMTSDYEDLIDLILMEPYEFKEKFPKQIKRIIQLVFNQEMPEDNIDVKVAERILVTEQLRDAKKLFVKLNLLMKRVDYLKGVVYSEDFLEPELPVEVDSK